MESTFGGRGAEGAPTAPGLAPGDMDGDRRVMTLPGPFGAWRRRLRSPAFRPPRTGDATAPITPIPPAALSAAGRGIAVARDAVRRLGRGVVPALACLALFAGVATQASAQALPTVSFTTTDQAKFEGWGWFPVRLTLNQAPTSDITVNYTVGGTATSGSDYTALSGTVWVPAGATTAEISVQLIPDGVPEDSETIILTLIGSADYRVGSSGTHTLTIAAPGTTKVRFFGYEVFFKPRRSENSHVHNVRVRLNPAPATDITVNYTVGGTATPGSDFTIADSGTLSVPAGAKLATIPVKFIDDTEGEYDETIVLTLTGSADSVVYGSRQITLIIAANDGPVTTKSFASESQRVDEGSGTHDVEVTLSPAPTADLTFTYTVGGTATPGMDYTTLSGTVTVPAGATKATIPVAVIDDSLQEGSETVVLVGNFGHGVSSPGTHTLTIVDDETPTVSFASASGSAGEGSGTHNVGLTLSPAPVTDTTLTYTVGGTATAGSDFTIANSGTVTVLAGATTATIPVTVIDDSTADGDETVVLTLVRGTDYYVGSVGTHTLTIADNEPTVSFASASQGVGEGSGTHNVGVTLSPAPSEDLTLAYTVGGTATAGSDYTALSGTVTVLAGATTATIPLTVIDDSAHESDETVVLTLVGSSGYGVGSPGTYTLTIADDDPAVSFASASQRVGEGAGTHNVEVTLSAAPTADTTFTYTVGGTATPGTDYTALSGTVTVLAGETTATIPVAVIDDAEGGEGDETVVLTLAGSGGYDVVSPGVHTLTIADNETGPATSATVQFASDTYRVNEGGTLTPELVLSHWLSKDVTVMVEALKLRNGAEGGTDYAAGPWRVTVPARHTRQTFDIATFDDDAREGEEEFLLHISPYGHSPGISRGEHPDATATIYDDTRVSLSGTEYTVTEGATATVPVSIAHPKAAAFTLDYTLTGAGGASDADIVGGLGARSVTVPANATGVSLAIATVQDTVQGEVGESVEVVLSTAATGVEVAGARATVRIADDDSPAVAFAASASRAGEDAGTHDVTVTLSPAPDTTLAVPYTVEGTALSGTDYTALSGTLTVPASATTATLPVAIVDDTAREGDETVVLTLGGGTTHTVGGQGTHTLTIADNDTPTVTFAQGSQHASESAGTRNVTVRLSVAQATPLALAYTVGGTATPGADYTALSGTLTVPAGTTSATLPVALVADGVDDPDETVVLTLAAGAGYRVGDEDTHTLYIDFLPLAQFRDHYWSTVREDSGRQDIRVELEPAPLSPLTLAYVVSGTATSGADYQALSGTVSVPAGATAATIAVTLIDDAHEDSGETVVLRLVGGTGYRVEDKGTGAVGSTNYWERPWTHHVVRILNHDADDLERLLEAQRDAAVAGGDTALANLCRRALALVRGETPPGGLAALTGAEARARAGVETGRGEAALAALWLDIAHLAGAATPPEPAVTIAAGTSPVTEGGDAAFTLTATPAPTADLAVSVTVATDGDYGVTAGTRTVTIPTTGSATLTLTTTGDEADEPDGSVTVTVTDGAGYTVGSSASGSVTVRDDDEAPPPPSGTALPGTVAAAVSNGVVTLARPSGWTGSGKIQFGGGSKTRDKGKFTTLRIENADADSFDVTWVSRAPGTLRLTLEWQPVAGSSWQPSDGGAQDPRVLTIEDPSATKPVVTVTAGGAVTEGAGAGFTVRRTGATAAALTVKLAVSEDGTGGRDFVAPGEEGDKEVVIGAGSAEATYTVPTGDDATDEPDGTVTLRLRDDNAYTSGSPSSATVTVRDDDGAPPQPVVTVSGGDAVTEGDSASFTLTATPAPAAPLSVSVTVAASGDYGVTAGPRTVTIPTTGSYTLTLATTGDDADEPDGSVSVTVTDDTGYTVGDPASGTVAIRDDDVPVVTVTAGDAVTEGDSATFTLTANPAPASPLPVSVTIATAGEYGLSAGPQTVSLPTTGSAVLSLPTTDDATDEPDGSVTATVEAGDGYTVGASASATVTLLDDDLPPPVVTIAANASSVTEGGDAAFTLTADRAPEAALTVALSVAETGTGDHVAATSEGPATAVIAQGETEAVFRVATVNDEVDEPDTSAVVTVEAGAGYTVGTPSSGTVTVEDDDTTSLPVLSVADVTAREGVDWMLTFTVRLSAPAPEAVEVRVDTRASTPVSAEPGHDYLPAPVGGHRVVFGAGETERPVQVIVLDDSHDEEAETFEVVLSEAKGANISDGVAVGTITNADPMPAAWLARFGRTVAEQALDGITGRMAAPRTPGMRGTVAGLPLDFGAPAGGAPGAWSGAGAGDAAAGTPALAGTGALALADVAQAFGGPADRSGVGGIDGGVGHDPAGIGFGNGFGETHSQSLTAREALLGSRFTLTGERDSAGGTAALWGRASQARFDGREGTFSLDGEATTALLGADYARGRWLVGLALAQSEGEGDYRDTKAMPRPPSQTCPAGAQGAEAELCRNAVRAGDGRVEASLTAALPYASVQASERLKLWGAAGVGSGEVTLATTLGGHYTADTTWRMAAAGLRGELLEASPEDSGPALALTSDALWTRTASEKTRDLAASESDVTRLRLGLEGSWRFALDGAGHSGTEGAGLRAGGASLTPKLEVGARHDGGGAETGFGIELGGGVAWSDPALGLSLDVSGRTLIAHEDDALEDRGVAASLGFDPNPASERGPSLTLRQELGARASGGLDALFAPDPLEDRTGGEATSRWTMEAAYGLPAFGGRFTASPHVGLGLSGAARDYTLGWRLAPEAATAPDLSFGLKATRRESDTAAPEHTVGFEVRASW